MGRSIKEAIERILGVPVLTNGRTDLGEIFKDAQKRESKAAQKNQKTQSLGNQHEALLKQRDGMQDETDRLRKELDSLRTGKASKEDLLRKTEKTKALLDDRNRLQEEIVTAEAKLKEKEDRRKELLTVAWKGLLSHRIRATRETLEQDLKDTRSTYERAVISTDLAEKLHKALDDGQCSTCGQDLSEGAFDGVVCRMAAHHFLSVPKFVAEAYRVLRPGGRLLVADSAGPDDAPEVDAWSNHVEVLRDGSHIRNYTPSEWRGFVTGAGFILEELDQVRESVPITMRAWLTKGGCSGKAADEVRRLFLEAPAEAVRTCSITRMPDGDISFQWARIALSARKPD
jgi:SAM-dependent methyltransferase